jgi:hypothetical protein
MNQKAATVDCPVCAQSTHIAIPDGIPLGTLIKSRCPQGHAFRVRVGVAGVDVLIDDPR